MCLLHSADDGGREPGGGDTFAPVVNPKAVLILQVGEGEIFGIIPRVVFEKHTSRVRKRGRGRLLLPPAQPQPRLL